MKIPQQKADYQGKIHFSLQFPVTVHVEGMSRQELTIASYIQSRAEQK